MSKIKGFGDLKDKDDGKDKKHNEFYTGGNNAQGGGSGMAVQAPPPAEDRFTKLVAQAKKPGEEIEGEKLESELVIYSNGFVWNSDPFRDISDPANQAILSDLEEGRVPLVLIPPGLDPSKTLFGVKLLDRRPAKYEPPPPPPYVKFGGSGNSTGVVVSETAYIFTGVELTVFGSHVCDEKLPNTLIQVKQAQGPKKLRLKMNLDATVADLAKLASELSDGLPFVLSAGYPPVDLADASQTIEKAGLKGASVILKTI